MDFLTNPFTTALLFLYQLLGQNIVLTIVVFTLLIRFLLFPLTYQQIKSSRKMQDLQPQLKALQVELKGNREKLGQAQMELYKKNGVNPLAGCLPLVVQMPILLGLYGAITRSLSSTPLQVLDLSHRILVPGLSHLLPMQNTFLIWNLGAPDSSYILPILVVITTWVQQKLLTPPPSGDPKDPSAAMSKQMLLIMPLMIGFFSLNFASGLSIYWTVGNLAVIAQYAALGRVKWRNLLPEFLLPKTAATVPATTSTAKAIKATNTAAALDMGSGSESSSKRKANISGPVGRPVVSTASDGDEAVSTSRIAAVPLRSRPKPAEPTASNGTLNASTNGKANGVVPKPADKSNKPKPKTGSN
jgi:YidC/Oxa1 family membrane protein insertase